MNKSEIGIEKVRIAREFDKRQADFINLRDSIDPNVFPDAYAAAAQLQEDAEAYSDEDSIEAEVIPDDMTLKFEINRWADDGSCIYTVLMGGTEIARGGDLHTALTNAGHEMYELFMQGATYV